MKIDKDIYYLTQGIAAVFVKYNIATIPVNEKFINNESVIAAAKDIKAIKAMLANLQVMLYNWEEIHKVPHPYNKILTDFYFKFWKLKNVV
jgi:hypothetical protein